MSGSRSSETQEGLKEAQEGLMESQEGLTGTQESLKETQEGLKEAQEGLTGTQEGLKETQESLTDTQESLTGTQEVLKEAQEGLTETQGGPAETQGGLTETQRGPAKGTDTNTTNTNHTADHQRLEDSSARPGGLQPPEKPPLRGQQESFQAEKTEAGKPPAGPAQPGQDPPPAEESAQESPPTVQADLGGPAVPKEPPGGHEQTLEASSASVQPASAGEPKLCGYLLKQGGPLKAWKLRWFTYEDQQNQLFYYRTLQDVTPLGRIELGSATFTYPLKAEMGTFHIRTPERTVVLKAGTQQLMLYWLQQLQVQRWRHRQTSLGHHPADDFLPLLKSPVGLVGEGAASVLSPRAPLADVSLKHPLIQIQNSVHSLRARVSRERSQSVFYVEAPGDPSKVTCSSPLRTPSTPSAPPPLAPPPSQEAPLDGREPSSFFTSWSRKKNRSPSTQVSGEPLSSEQTCRLQQDNQRLAEEVKAQKELVWILHKALEASQLEKRACDEFLAEDGEQERLEVLRHRERQAAGLQAQLEEAKMEAEALRRSLAQRNTQLQELEEQIKMWTEKNDAKQQVILKLSNQLSTCMVEQQVEQPNQTLRQLQQQMENLQDDMEAYKTQNRFLNSEIYQLTRLWRSSSEQERSLMTKAAYLEARTCQVQSRYLEVLRQLQDTKSLDASQQEAVQELVEEALRREGRWAGQQQGPSGHDAYGFQMFPEYEVEDLKLLAKIQALEIRAHHLQQEAPERPLLERWAHFLAARSAQDLRASPELKGLLRGGVPQEYRRQLWTWMVHVRTGSIREQEPDGYQQLCQKSGTSPHPASRQIELDLPRTLTTNQLFSSPSSPALQQLRRILLAFSWRNPAIGYCQGLNRLAAVALLVLQSEEEAFWCLVAIVETIMPQDYYTQNLVASQADQRVLKDFLLEKLPRISAHFASQGVDVSLVTFNWFLVVFVESLPSDILLPLWDAFLYEGTKVIFRYALALFKYKEDDILKIHSSVELYQYLRFFTKTITDTRRLSNMAFGDMNPFPGRLLRSRRALHLERLQGELQRLAQQQEAFVAERAQRKDKDLDTAASEDDDELGGSPVWTAGTPADSAGIAGASEGTRAANAGLSSD